MGANVCISHFLEELLKLAKDDTNSAKNFLNIVCSWKKVHYNKRKDLFEIEVITGDEEWAATAFIPNLETKFPSFKFELRKS